MNWLNRLLYKDARGRKFRPGDKVRFLTNPRKGRGKGVVLMPDFGRGEILDYDPDNRQYKVRSDTEELSVHPRNILPESFAPRSMPEASPAPTPMVAPTPMAAPFPR